MKKKYNFEDIINICENLSGKTLRQYLNLDINTDWEYEISKLFKSGDKNNKNKGAYGNYIQKKIFGIDINSDNNPDFKELGIELKVAPFKKLVKDEIRTHSAKERVVLSKIDYKKLIHEKNFEKSHIYAKINKTLFIFYENIPNKDKLDLKILKYKYIELKSSNDFTQIEREYNEIKNKVFNGLAHELSESLTKILGACTKGSKNEPPTKQPNSNILAKKRAFSYKPMYINKIFYQNDVQNLIIEEKFIENINFRIKHYLNMKLSDIIKEKNNTVSKNKKRDAIYKILNIKNYSEIEGIKEHGYKIKNIEINRNNIKEEIGIVNISVNEFINDCDFYDSEFCIFLESFKMLFIVWDKKNNDSILLGTKVFEFSEELINCAGKVYEDTKKKYLNGIKIEAVNSKKFNNLISCKDNMKFHVRPHARNGNDTTTTPFNQVITKQQFWLNKSVILELIKEIKK